MSARDKERAKLNRIRQEIAKRYDTQIKTLSDSAAALLEENKNLKAENKRLAQQLDEAIKLRDMTPEEFQQLLNDIERGKRIQSLVEKTYGVFAHYY